MRNHKSGKPSQQMPTGKCQNPILAYGSDASTTYPGTTARNKILPISNARPCSIQVNSRTDSATASPTESNGTSQANNGNEDDDGLKAYEMPPLINWS